MNSLERHLPDIIDKVRKGKAILFLGAGASVASGGPTEAQLVQEIKKFFPKVDKEIKGLLDAAQDLLETPGYDRTALDEFITSKLSPLKPSASHASLVKYHWASIVTTNYDELIEDAYRNCKQRKPFYVVSYPHSSPVMDHSKAFIFKIMGTIKNRPENRMMLSRTDYNKMIAKKSEYLKALEDFVRVGTIIFIGYKGADRIVVDIIDELIESVGLDKVPWSYVLLKDDNLSDKEMTRFNLHKMIPINCSFEHFFSEIDAKISDQLVTLNSQVTKSVNIRVEGQELQIDRKDMEMYSEFYQLLNEDLTSEEIENQDDFFKGAIDNYAYYRQNIDFIREIYDKPNGIKERVFNELRNKEKNGNKIILLTGPPGVGKSVLLHRLAYDVYADEKAPVIFFDKTQSQLDFKLLTSLLVQLNREYDKVCKTERGHRLKSLIVIDDANSINVDPIFIKDYLSSRGRLATIVAAVRDNEIADLKINLPESDIYRINESLSYDEKTDIIDYLFDKKFIPTCDTTWDRIVEQEFEGSFFATMYSLVQHSQKPFNEIIKDEYERLSPRTKQAFACVCAFNQFGLPINLELLLRALNCSYDELYTQILPTAKGIIFEELKQDFLLYTAHHRIIAKKTIDFFFGDIFSEKELFLQVLNNVNLRNWKERELVQKLLISYLGPKSRSTDLLSKHKIEIFEKVCRQDGTKALLHHWGILLTDEGEYSKAETVLTKAINMHDLQRAHFTTELDQNILTSLGNLYAKRGLQFMQSTEKETKEAGEMEIKRAESFFLRARFGGYPNGHSYHAHANMYLLKGDLIKDELERVRIYGISLDILQAAKDNLNDDILQPILELEAVILNRVGKQIEAMETAAKIAEKYGSATGYTLVANILLRTAKFSSRPVDKLIAASNYVEEGLKRFPTDESCLRLKAQLIRKLHPNNERLYFSTLKNWFINASSPNVWLYFELGVMAFKFEEYKFSKDVFLKLEDERISGGLRKRFMEMIFRDRFEHPLVFFGNIIRLDNKYDGEIRCDSLKNFPYTLHFRPIACGFQPAEGDLVEFNIAFDYLGPRAVNIRKKTMGHF
ncbi:MAG: SIR2 family protein [Candidatus Bathyarchaeota archaeon]|nr:SIR2 family protein [Candidatus Bathyarchaeota archaeon]